MGRSQHAPRMPTILIALALMIVGLFSTFGTILTDQIGAWAFVAAAVLLLIGIFIEGI
jgi:hypothetical protein